LFDYEKIAKTFLTFVKNENSLKIFANIFGPAFTQKLTYK